MIRVALETSITRFVATGLGVYASNLAHALRQNGDIEVVPCAIPEVLGRAPHPLLQKLFAAYWQMIHARVILPRKAHRLTCDLIHYTMTMPIPSRMPCPVITTVHDLIPLVHPEWVPPVRGRRMRHGIKSSVERADHLITDSEATRQDLLSHFPRQPQSVTTVLLGADSQLPKINSDAAAKVVETHYQLQPGYILCVGSIEPRKNLERVIAAYGKLKRRTAVPPPLVLVGGSVWRHERLRTQIARAGLEQSVRFTGHVPAMHLAALYRCAGVFTYPSLYEGFGLPPLEAMGCGCPVITSNTSSLPEAVGQAAVLVDPNNVRQLAEAIEDVLRDQTLAQQLREDGYKHVQRYSWQRCAHETVNVYRRVLEEK